MAGHDQALYWPERAISTSSVLGAPGNHSLMLMAMKQTYARLFRLSIIRRHRGRPRGCHGITHNSNVIWRTQKAGSLRIVALGSVEKT